MSAVENAVYSKLERRWCYPNCYFRAIFKIPANDYTRGGRSFSHSSGEPR